MVRYARSNNVGTKKPQAASSWEEMSAELKADTRVRAQSQIASWPIEKPAMKAKFQRKMRKLLDSGGLDSVKDADTNEDSVENETEGLATLLEGTPVLQDLQKSKPKAEASVKHGKGKKSKKEVIKDKVEKIKNDHSLKMSEDEEKKLEEFVKKDERREDRRLKRINEKAASRTCFHCRKEGHTIADCPEVKDDLDQGSGICFKCGSTEHSVHQCRVKLPSGEYPYAKCFLCKEVGHISKQCPDNPRGLYPNGGCCLSCGSVEHYKKDCPVQQQKQGIEDVKLGTIHDVRSADDDWEFKPTPIVRQKKKGPKVVNF